MALATVHKTYIQVEVPPPPPPPPLFRSVEKVAEVRLTLSPKEAVYLKKLIGLLEGHGPATEVLTPIYRALDTAGVPFVGGRILREGATYSNYPLDLSCLRGWDECGPT